MATTLYLLDTVPDTHLGAPNVRLRDGVGVAWISRGLGTARGSGVVASAATATVLGPTTGIEVSLVGTTATEWISPPLAADATISGTITANIWSSESNMSANVAVNVIVEVIRANATATANSNTLVEIGRSARVIEVAVTTRAVNNFTFTPTSTAVNRGDRLRVRVFADDVGTMAFTYTWDISYNGSSASADGDSFVTFSENISFESAPGVLAQTDHSTFGETGASQQRLAQPFVVPTGQTSLTEVRVWLSKNGAPTDDLVLEIESDSAGSPSGTVIGTVATVGGASLTTTQTEYTYTTAISVTAGVTYWLTTRRSTGQDVSKYFWVGFSTVAVSGWASAKNKTYVGGVWATDFSPQAITVRLTFNPTTLYLTDTASDVSTASVDREAWTSRGAGVQTDVVNTAAGWTAPIQLTDTAGGTAVDWFTRPLTAFTLGGMAVANLPALESNAAANASLRCQVARVANDGTSPTVWADWAVAPTSTDNGELTTSEVARTANVSGDDLAITDGQRLRIRLYAEDSSNAAMAASQTVTVYYAGTSAAASGDSYITLPQTVTEYSAGGTTYTKAGYGRESA